MYVCDGLVEVGVEGFQFGYGGADEVHHDFSDVFAAVCGIFENLVNFLVLVFEVCGGIFREFPGGESYRFVPISAFFELFSVIGLAFVGAEPLFKAAAKSFIVDPGFIVSDDVPGGEEHIGVVEGEEFVGCGFPFFGGVVKVGAFYVEFFTVVGFEIGAGYVLGVFQQVGFDDVAGETAHVVFDQRPRHQHDFFQSALAAAHGKCALNFFSEGSTKPGGSVAQHTPAQPVFFYVVEAEPFVELIEAELPPGTVGKEPQVFADAPVCRGVDVPYEERVNA